MEEKETHRRFAMRGIYAEEIEQAFKNRDLEPIITNHYAIQFGFAMDRIY